MQTDLIRSQRGKVRWVVEDRGFATPCWIWQLAMGHDDYGRWRGTTAHRAVYEALRGPIPSGLQVDHLCRVHRCVNPDHLEPVTCKENLRRGIRGKKLSEDEVRFIRRHLAEGQSGRSLAMQFGVSQSMVSNIRHRTVWADID